GIQTGDRDRCAGRIQDSGQRVHDSHRQDSIPIVDIRNGSEIQVTLQLPESFVIREEKHGIPDEGAAKRRPKLVALEGWFWRRRKLKSFRIQTRVAKKLVYDAVELIRS